MHDGDTTLAALEADGLVCRERGRWRTTRRWQSAMARAALHFLDREPDDFDLRLPIAHALVELYGVDIDDRELARRIETMLPIEVAELRPDELAQ